jgi:hypothetical protein
MEEQGDGTSGGCPGASATGETVSLYGDHNHPLLQRTRALPWEALCEVMTRHWRPAGNTPDGRPGFPWDVALSVPLLVWMLVQPLNAREREAYLAANVGARVFMGRQGDPRAQIRDPSTMARASAALGQEGMDAINRRMLPVAKDWGCADGSILSSDTTAQAFPIGSPNAPGLVRGWGQRCGRALGQRNTRGGWGVDHALAEVQTRLRSVKEHHLCAKGKQAKRQVVTRLRTAVGPWLVQTRPRVPRLGQSRDRVTHRATATLVALHEGAQRLIPQSVPWSTTGVVAKGTIVPVGVTPARALVRHKAGQEVECGLPYLLSRRGGGDIFGRFLRGVVDESKRPFQALAGYRTLVGAHATPALRVYARGG